MPHQTVHPAAPPAPGTHPAPPPPPATTTTAVVSIFVPRPGPLGATLKSTDDRAGAVVEIVHPGGQAHRAGLRKGDVPVFMGRKIGIDAFIDMCKHGARPLAFQVWRSATGGASLVGPAPVPVATAPVAVGAKGAPPSMAAPKENAPNRTDMLAAAAKKAPANAPRVSLSPVPPVASSGVAMINDANALAAAAPAAAGAVATKAPVVHSPAPPAAAGAAAANAPAPAVPIPTGQELARILAMTTPELRAELTSRRIKHVQSAGRDDLLEQLGVPARRWHAWRKSKVKELKEILKARGAKVSGTKDELLERLGMPKNYGLTPHEISTKEFNERERQRKREERAREKRAREAASAAEERARGAASSSVGAALLATAMLAAATKKAKRERDLPDEEDPTHWSYCVCCDNQEFKCNENEPVGCIFLPGGSMAEAWRCVSCGEIPHYPNAPSVQVYDSTDDEEDEGDGSMADFLGIIPY